VWPSIISRLLRRTRGRTTAFAFSREEAQHASFLCARAVPRRLWSAGTLGQSIASARGLSISARGRGATYQLRPPIISRLSCGTRERATALAVSREEVQHASLILARRAALVVVGPFTREGHCTDKRPLSARGRGATYQLRPPRISRCSRGTRERRAARITVGLNYTKVSCTGEKALFFVSQWTDEAALCTSHRGLATKERRLSPVQCPFKDRWPTIASAARRARATTLSTSPSPHRQGVQRRARACHVPTDHARQTGCRV
jgi:hypothetical protein